MYNPLRIILEFWNQKTRFAYLLVSESFPSHNRSLHTFRSTSESLSWTLHMIGAVQPVVRMDTSEMNVHHHCLVTLINKILLIINLLVLIMILPKQKVAYMNKHSNNIEESTQSTSQQVGDVREVDGAPPTISNSKSEGYEMKQAIPQHCVNN